MRLFFTLYITTMPTVRKISFFSLFLCRFKPWQLNLSNIEIIELSICVLRIYLYIYWVLCSFTKYHYKAGLECIIYCRSTYYYSSAKYFRWAWQYLAQGSRQFWYWIWQILSCRISYTKIWSNKMLIMSLYRDLYRNDS